MLRPRLIPCLLIHNGGLVKTKQFADPIYVGDPVNTVRIFNEKEVDELLVVDIDATTNDREPNYELIAQLAAECRMPLAYGGGVKNAQQIERIISLGVEKVAISSAAVANPDIITAGAAKVGNQSIAIVADVITDDNGEYRVYTHNGTVNSGLSPSEFASIAEKAGAGEFVINNINRDGMESGYDLDLVEQCRKACSLPMTVVGGAGSMDDIKSLIQYFPIIGAGAGSLFVFKGKYKAVLVNYPNMLKKQSLYCAE